MPRPRQQAMPCKIETPCHDVPRLLRAMPSDEGFQCQGKRACTACLACDSSPDAMSPSKQNWAHGPRGLHGLPCFKPTAMAAFSGLCSIVCQQCVSFVKVMGLGTMLLSRKASVGSAYIMLLLFFPSQSTPLATLPRGPSIDYPAAFEMWGFDLLQEDAPERWGFSPVQCGVGVAGGAVLLYAALAERRALTR